mmetsp:Transcript_2943/g.4342  ORF Transcript_2943/g.4342 Transcript_2943/m.4342 type:complete len:108 (-) Transcript_2943:124-447(-)
MLDPTLGTKHYTVRVHTHASTINRSKREAMEQSPENMDNFWKFTKIFTFHFNIYFMVGMTSALHALWSRWEPIKTKHFSPAYVAFCFPSLSQAKSVQFYHPITHDTI